MINGDLEQIHAGISDADIQLLYDEVDIVIHAAADVRFNIPLMDLVKSNVRGTRELLDIATKMKHLEVFAYVSTAYSHCPREGVEEQFYEPPMDPFFWLDALETYKTQAEQDLIEIIEPHIMHPWPNSYTYTKALSEHVVKCYSHHFPTIVIRPSISKFIKRVPLFSHFQCKSPEKINLNFPISSCVDVSGSNWWLDEQHHRHQWTVCWHRRWLFETFTRENRFCDRYHLCGFRN